MTLGGFRPADVPSSARVLQPRPRKMVPHHYWAASGIKFQHRRLGVRPQRSLGLQQARRVHASFPEDTLICSSIEDWLRPDCDWHCSMHIPRPAEWPDVQGEVDEAAACRAFGPTGTLSESVMLSSNKSAELTAKAQCLVGRALRAGLPSFLCKQIQLDIEDMGMTMARMLPGRPKLNLGLEIVGENNCRKWHQDHLSCRAIISYNGCGTEYLDKGNVNFDALKNRGVNEQILKKKCEVFSAGVGDMLLMKGLNFPSTANGLVHKSPDTRYHSDGRCVNRLCLKLDVA